MTKSTYEILDNGIIKRTDKEGNVVWIPTDPANSDYQAYLNKDNPDWNKPNII